METIPDDIIIHNIFPYLDTRSMCCLACSRKNWFCLLEGTSNLNFPKGVSSASLNTFLKFSPKLLSLSLTRMLSSEDINWALICTTVRSLALTWSAKSFSFKFFQDYKFPELVSVDFTGSSKVKLETLKSLPIQIQKLDLTNCTQVNDSLLKELPLIFPDLKSLTLKGCYKITPANGISEIKNFKQIEELSIVNINSPTIAVTFGNIIPSIVSHCTNIRFLRLCRCRIDNNSLIAVGKYLHGTLEEFRYKFAHSLCDNDGMISLLTDCNQISKLDIQGGPWENSLLPVIGNLIHLEHLDIRDCPKLDSIPDFEYLFKNCSKLSHLAIRSLAFNGDILKLISTHCHYINLLDLQACENLRADSIVEFLEYPLFFLKYLNVTQIIFSEEDIERIKEAASLFHTQKFKKYQGDYNDLNLPKEIKLIWEYIEKKSTDFNMEKLVHNFQFPLVLVNIGETKLKLGHQNYEKIPSIDFF